MIPKKIHYCWFGGKPLPESAEKCIASWRRYCPDYEIVRHDESNYDVNKNEYLRAAYKSGLWAFVTDYARLDIVCAEGGIYLDTDVELLKSLDTLLESDAYMGMEQVGRVNTGLGFGAVKNHPFIRKNKEYYEENGYKERDESGRKVTCVAVTTVLLEAEGLERADEEQNVGGVKIYPVEYFCPLKMGTSKLTVTPNTYSIHHYDSSWFTGSPLVKRIKYRLIPLKQAVRKYLLKEE